MGVNWPYRELRVDGDVVNIVGDVLDLGVVFALAADRRCGTLEGSHGGERACGCCAGSD